jgi:large subunit ribosomal protein L17
MGKLFGPLRERYANRPGGYTRVLRIEPLKPDQAPSAILELVDGPKDMRFAMTAKTLVKQRGDGVGMNEITAVNIRKVTRFREGGEDELEAEVLRLEREQRRVQREEQEEGETEWVGYGSNVGKRKVKKDK